MSCQAVAESRRCQTCWYSFSCTGTVDLVVQRVDCGEHGAQVEPVAHHGVSRNDLRCRTARAILQTRDEARAATVDHVIAKLGGYDLAPQTVAADFIRIFLLHLLREIAEEIGLEMGFVRDFAGHQLVKQHDLRIGQKNADFRPRQRLSPCFAFRDLLRSGQKLHATVKKATLLQKRHHPRLVRKLRQPALLDKRDRQGLLVVVLKHQLGDFFRHLRKQLVARLPRQ